LAIGFNKIPTVEALPFPYDSLTSQDLLDILITHRLPMSRVQDAWELQMKGGCGKIVLDPLG
jgi:hypothetical protein